ncbi:MAG TPA: hypothetical protein VH062_24490 [Polyangiaceae bacterium]|jgi:hypothetical protein|nr:hypothetical protein [Polyangiaceae bacterium]
MTYESDPPRLVYTGDPEDPFVQALEAARDDLPNDEQLARMAAAFSPFGGAAKASGFWSPKRKLRVRSLQAAAVALAAAVGVGATVKLLNPFSFTKTEVAEAPVQEPGPSPQPGVVKRPRVTAPMVVPVAPSAEEPTERAPEPKPRAPSASASVHHEPVATAQPSRPSQADLPSTDMDGPENETALLERAHHALGSSPARALALTEEHRRAYPAGVLGQESDLIAIEALVALGRDGDARSAAARFRTRYPSSAHLRRIDRLLGNAAGAPAPSSP